MRTERPRGRRIAVDVGRDPPRCTRRAGRPRAAGARDRALGGGRDGCRDPCDVVVGLERVGPRRPAAQRARQVQQAPSGGPDPSRARPRSRAERRSSSDTWLFASRGRAALSHAAAAATIGVATLVPRRGRSRPRCRRGRTAAEPPVRTSTPGADRSSPLRLWLGKAGARVASTARDREHVRIARRVFGPRAPGSLPGRRHEHGPAPVGPIRCQQVGDAEAPVRPAVAHVDHGRAAPDRDREALDQSRRS